jgi:GMP synthase-like glutamine amidotransferase
VQNGGTVADRSGPNSPDRHRLRFAPDTEEGPLRALFIQHDPGSKPGLVGDALTRHGFDIELLEMSDTIHDGAWNGAFPDPLDYDLVVPLGAIWSLYDQDAVGTWIDRELELLRRADGHGVPVFGICFGGQALAAAHGGDVGPAPRPELGWVEIATDDPDLVPPGPWMQWHTDRFTLPPDAIELARNDVGPQAFLLRRNLAVQFHPEVDEETVASWFAMSGDEAHTFAASASVTVEQVLDDTRANKDLATSNVERMVARFLADVAELR